MRRCLVGSLVVLVVAVASVVPADAAGFRGRTIVKKKALFSKTVTTSVYTADLTQDGNTPPGGTATYTVTTIDVRICWWRWTSTCVTLTVDVNDLPFPEGQTVNFYAYDDPNNLLGSADVTDQQTASLSLSSKQGDVIPDFLEGDSIQVTDDVFNLIVWGDFGSPTVTTTTCGNGGGSSGGSNPN